MPNDPKRTPAELAVYERLKKVRASKTVRLKPIDRLRTQIKGLDGKMQPFNLRYYQVQGVYHMMVLKRMLLGDGTGLGKCLTEDSLLVTDQGLLPIWQLAPLDGLDDNTFYEPRITVNVWVGDHWTSVRRFFWNGETDTLRATTRNGYRVEGSLQHPLLTRTSTGEKFVPLRALAKGDFVCIDRTPVPFPESDPTLPAVEGLAPHAKKYTYPEKLTPNLARLLAYVVAEAWTASAYSVNISQYREVNPETYEDIRALLKETFGWAPSGDNQEGHRLFPVASIGIRRFFEQYGIGYGRAQEKCVPWPVFQGSEASVKGFLRALLDAEGSVVPGGVEFSTASEKLSQEVQLLLLRLGIVSTRRPKKVLGFDHTYWRVTFFGDDARKYQDVVGFISVRKVEALEASLGDQSNPNKDVVPLVGDQVRDLKKALLEAVSFKGANEQRVGTGLKQFGESFQSTLKHVIHGRRNPTYAFLQRFLEICQQQGLQDHEAFQEISTVVQKHYFYDPVEALEPGRCEVMDIEVADEGHCFSANGFVNHNTVETLVSFCYLWHKEPKNKVMIVAPKSAIRQWASEIERFAKGIKVIVVTSPKTSAKGAALKHRKKLYQEWVDAPTGPDDPKVVLVLNYALLQRDWNAEGYQPLKPNGKPDPKKPVVPGLLDAHTRTLAANLVVIYDEATAFKSMRTKTWEVCRFLSERSHRVYGLTATLLKNHLMEGYSIYKAIKPDLFGTKTKFMDDYCYTKMQAVSGNRKIPVVIGYKNLQHFRQVIDPFFLGRPKHAVSDELPSLTTREVVCEMSKAEDSKYSEALSGVLELGDGDIRDYEDHKALVSLTYCQQVVNSLTMLKYVEGDDIEGNALFDAPSNKLGRMGAKEQALVDIVTGELDGEKVIVYTRFASLVGRLQAILKREGVKSVRITGKENDKQRGKNQDKFQDLESDTNVIFITSAGSEAINLQAAVAEIFYDAPYSWGDYVQTLGRMIRIGSPHQAVLAYHLIAERPSTVKKSRKTIDHHVLSLLRKKKGLIDKVLGEAAVGALKFDKTGSDVAQLIKAMQEGI